MESTKNKLIGILFQLALDETVRNYVNDKIAIFYDRFRDLDEDIAKESTDANYHWKVIDTFCELYPELIDFVDREVKEYYW